MSHSESMLRAVALAADTRPHPNPRVGAVVLNGAGEVVGEGAHAGPGEPHAEVLALEAAGGAASRGTLFVTLEPCSHHGRTPPCVDAIIASGIGRVVVGMQDPDPRVSGSGIEALEQAGIEVIAGVEREAAEALDPGYFIHRRTGRPRVTLKWASTLDGQVAARDGSSQWITSEAARADAHLLRADADAVMVGAGTLRSDDPRLDARIEGVTRQPRPVILAGRQPLPRDRRIWERDPVVISTRQGEGLTVPSGPDGLPDITKSLYALADLGIVDLLVEGGPTLAKALWDLGLVDRAIVYLAGSIAGGTGKPPLEGVFGTMTEMRRVTIVGVRRVGPDLRVEVAA